MKQRLIWITTLLVTVLLTVMASCGSAATPAPAPGSTPATPSMSTQRQGRGVSGTLAKMDGNMLNLTTAQGSVTVNVSSDTMIQKTVTGTLSDIHEGASVFVTGSQDANGNISATSIMIRPQGQGAPSTPPVGATPRSDRTPTTPGNGRNPRPPDGGAGRGANGTLAKIDGNTLTLTTAQGQVIVNVGSGTTVQMTTTGTLSDLHEGESLTVIGTPDANSNINAVSIMIRPQGQGIPPASSSEA